MKRPGRWWRCRAAGDPRGGPDGHVCDVELGRVTSRLVTFSAGVLVAAVVGGPGRAPTPAVAASADTVTLTGVLTAADRDWGGERTFIVPSGTSAIDIDLTCAGGETESLLDFGVGGPAGLRGWSTARHDHVHMDALSASLGYLPGPIEAGQWRVLLGAPPRHDGSNTAYQITVRLSNGPAASWPVLRSSPGWFAGDLHVHSGHSDGYREDTLGRQRPVLVRDLIAAGNAAQLDFLAVTDHNTASHWIDIDRAQAASPNLLLLHGREITTARGHFNAIGERRFTDFRLGPRRPMQTLLEEVARDGAFVSINHAWLTSSDWCSGCGWADRDPDTMQRVAGIEVLNGSTPTPGIDGPGGHSGRTAWSTANAPCRSVEVTCTIRLKGAHLSAARRRLSGPPPCLKRPSLPA